MRRRGRGWAFTQPRWITGWWSSGWPTAARPRKPISAWATFYFPSPAKRCATLQASSAASGRKGKLESTCRSRCIATARPWTFASNQANAIASSRARAFTDLLRRQQRAQTFTVGRIQQPDAERALERVVAHAPAFLPEAQCHWRHGRCRALERNFGWRRDTEKLRGKHHRFAKRRRFVIGDIENARRTVRKRGIDRLRDVADMNAIKDLSRLDDAARFAACDLKQCILCRPVNAGEAKDGDSSATAFAELLPGLLGRKPRAP